MKRALLIYPPFSPMGFWNYKDVCKLVGAKYPAAPLGIITLAALLPQEWDLKLVDMNTSELYDSDIDWADIVFISGMLPQQANFLKLIDRIHSHNKKIVAGGPDPTSQPDIYKDVDYLVLGEAENNIHLFLADLENGVNKNIYRNGKEKPCIKTSPVPRFDLLNLKDYVMIGIQFSRGCPFNCEFCDIIELYGRKPRTKTPQQVIKELDALYDLGYRGHIDFVDDNFIGHIKKTKEILRAVKTWYDKHDKPFFFSTEASINLADDNELLQLMKDLDFRYIFIGIESMDKNVLETIQKKQNLNRDLLSNLNKIYDYGIIVNGGFILGFDDETSQAVYSMADIIKQGKICMPMIGLLYALPRTRLTRRLIKEKRFINNSNLAENNDRHYIDQTTCGLNFLTRRPKEEIIEDYISILKNVYSRKNYFNRCLELCKILKKKKYYKMTFLKKLKSICMFGKLLIKIGINPYILYYFWRNIIIILFCNPGLVVDVINLMAMHLHFKKQTKYITDLMECRLENAQ